ncbi:Bug family tripartite tricarboxylate transporter substrate binding protein [Silicimonas sp. MF1-12-2]|uniref:Bug family tripartite tricarboxylate transporter substrate binding protein n=1 Tax=Silicimonas sp. MF1-12-2 TaxID=3384793 RepID=UPI0039B3F4CB
MFLKSLKKTVGAALVATLGLGTAAYAEYPEKPITLVIPLGAGGSHDLNARVITSIIPQYLNQAMIVRLSPGAGGQKGTQEVANSAADGYTLLFSHNYIDMLQQHVENLPYDPNADFVPVARVNYAPIAVVVRGDSEFNTFEELIAAAKANPGSIDMAHSGNWGALFVPAAQIMKATDSVFNLVPFQGGGPAMQALLSGDADMTMAFPSTLSALLEAGKVKVLATAGDERIYEDVPSFAEVGVGGDVGFMHRVVLAPAGTPEDVLDKLEQAFTALQEDTTYKRMMERLGENTDHIGRGQYQEMRKAQNGAYKDLVSSITQ